MRDWRACRSAKSRERRILHRPPQRQKHHKSLTLKLVRDRHYDIDDVALSARSCNLHHTFQKLLVTGVTVETLNISKFISMYRSSSLSRAIKPRSIPVGPSNAEADRQRIMQLAALAALLTDRTMKREREDGGSRGRERHNNGNTKLSIDTNTHARANESYKRNAIPFLGFLAVTYHERFRHNTDWYTGRSVLIIAVELKGNPPSARKLEHFCESNSYLESKSHHRTIAECCPTTTRLVVDNESLRIEKNS
ncbi:PREDICTED: uncharacterized protein LOC105448897 [Wasmannia auropunctata]|uniref:uncharacterized protein LOC105448897 n=1 Tax=Wasmannia auropunctata TaxID=64793 RepID=UPI0005EE3410|nr:PREDICTED: uncharacterized protein LOC105448897 [Wasmannia auropunctata]